MYLHPVIQENAKEPGKGVKMGIERKKNKLIVAAPLALRYMQKLLKKKKKKLLCLEVVGRRLSLKLGCGEIAGNWDGV